MAFYKYYCIKIIALINVFLGIYDLVFQKAFTNKPEEYVPN